MRCGRALCVRSHRAVRFAARVAALPTARSLHTNSRSGSGKDADPVGPPTPPQPPPAPPHPQALQQVQEPLPDVWDDALLFYDWTPPHESHAHVAPASAAGVEAAGTEDVFPSLFDDNSLGVAAAMAVAEAAGAVTARQDVNPMAPPRAATDAQPRGEEGKKKKEEESGTGNAASTAMSSEPSAPLSAPPSLARPDLCTRDAAAAALTTGESDAELAAYFREHHGFDTPSDDPLAEAEAAMREYDAMHHATPSSHSQQQQRQQPPRQRSSRSLLNAEAGPHVASDLVAEEEAVAENNALVAADLWQQYAPTEKELSAALGDDVALDANRSERVEADDEDDLQDRFWWQQPRAGHAASVDIVGAEALPQLRIPDKDGHVAANDSLPASASATAASPPPPPPSSSTGSSTANSLVTRPFPPIAERMAVRRSGFLVQQDRLYLAPQTPPEAQAPTPSSMREGSGTAAAAVAATVAARRCVLVAFAANDLRVHDNYALALASVRAHAAGGLPVVAVCVLDYRTFAQPSVVGGFFRQSPLRASFLLECVAKLREKLEQELRVPLLVRVGRPEEHVPRLAVELGAVDVFLTTQSAPHERRVHDAIVRAVRRGAWVCRRELDGDELAEDVDDGREADEQTVLVHVQEHDASSGDLTHPYGGEFTTARQSLLAAAAGGAASPPSGPSRADGFAAVPHSVWQTTLVHLDDLPTPVAAMKEGERWYHDDVTIATIRPTKPYDRQVEKLKELPCWSELLPSPARTVDGQARNAVVRGAIPSLFQLGYALDGRPQDLARLQSPEELIATQSSHPTGGEDAAMARVADWLADGGLTSMLRYGKPRRGNTKMYSHKLSRVSPYLSTGALSPRKLYELIRSFAHDNLRDGFVHMQYREALLRLSRRDYWHWMGLRYGDRLFYSYGPHPDATDGLPDWRHDPKIVQKWCLGLTGIPFADAAMRELLTTGYVAHEGRQALVWLLVRGYGQDWRLGAEWLERCSLDYDPFTCYGNAAYFGELIRDDFGETVRNTLYLAHRHDQTGIYIKKWLPQLSKVPPVYIHRPHVLTPRMQAMHGVYLGKNYPFPLKLWDGAQRTLSAAQLPAYFAGDHLTSATASADAVARGPGYAEAARCGVGLMEPEELSTAVHVSYLVQRPWARNFLPDTTLAAISIESGERSGGDEEASAAEADALFVKVTAAASRRKPLQEEDVKRRAVSAAAP